METRSDRIYNRIGIYGIQNKINGHIYIGKTGMNFGDRWDSHRSLLRSGKHFNLYLLRHLINKHTHDNPVPNRNNAEGVTTRAVARTVLVKFQYGKCLAPLMWMKI